MVSVDAYGRLLPTGTTSGNDRADAEPADTSVNTRPTVARHGEREGPKVKKARERYESDMRNAWRHSHPGA